MSDFGTWFPQIITYVLLALSGESILFSGAGGFSRALRAARRPALLRRYSVLVGCFSLFTISLSCWLDPWLSGLPRPTESRVAVILGADLLLYLLAAWLLRRFCPGFWEKTEKVFSPAAINTIVLAMPFLQRYLKLTWPQAIGYAVGTGLAFWLGAQLLNTALRRASHKETPAAYKGLPAALLYIGILCLAFYGFTGGRFI